MEWMEVRCRHFSGYKPCPKSKECLRHTCRQFDPIEENVLVVHLGALGAVVRSTALLAALKIKHPKSRLIWITESPAHIFLQGHSLLDQVIDLKSQNLLEIRNLKFSSVYAIDKSKKVSGILSQIKFENVFGFVCDEISGAILPATEHADELWQIGLSNDKKFFENKKTENQLVHEALNLGKYHRDPYSLEMTKEEWAQTEVRHKTWKKNGEFVLGLNVGCSSVIPYKKMSVELQRQVIMEVQRAWGSRLSVVLLGGKEDQELAWAIGKDLDVVVSPLDQGLRDGMISVAACDILVSGDSLGMHLGIAFQKWVVAWFGPTCAHEIDLFDRGVHVSASVPCGPCWRRVCSNTPMCYDRVPINKIVEGIKKGIEWKFLSSKQLSPEICF